VNMNINLVRSSFLNLVLPKFTSYGYSMFTTFRPNQEKDSLDAVRRTSNPPVLKGGCLDACRRCREKKVFVLRFRCQCVELTLIAQVYWREEWVRSMFGQRVALYVSGKTTSETTFTGHVWEAETLYPGGRSKINRNQEVSCKSHHALAVCDITDIS
jgi:hypothetical protein